jgi:GT2 family glycosyltransferase
MQSGGMRTGVGIVVIGRNEGERLKTCLASFGRRACPIVYVDSGSLDRSVRVAQSAGAITLELDLSTPFTAARARNAGFTRLLEVAPDLAYVQFVDGDCELADGWMQAASAWLDAHAEVAAVCGRLKEKYPRRTIYNLLCDIEWDRPAGETRSCGGIAMIRSRAFVQVGGYREDLIAGEEPEMCVRLRARSWRVYRLPNDMGHHDAALLRFPQWWRRTLRGGYAFAQAMALHGGPPERQGVRESRGIWLWAFAIPASAVAVSLVAGNWAWWLLLAYPAQVARLASRGRRSTGENWAWAAFTVLGKFAEFAGQLKFLAHRFTRRPAALIEHK